MNYYFLKTFFKESISFIRTRLLDTYNPNLRFVATQTGLTKWQIIPKPKPGKNTTSDFVTAYPKTISEPW